MNLSETCEREKCVSESGKREVWAQRWTMDVKINVDDVILGVGRDFPMMP
jgi:hypothetical protein